MGVKDLSIAYEAVNKERTFSGGDPVTGRVTFKLDKDTKVKSVFIKMKGDANVSWTENSGTGDDKTSDTYSAHKRYFKLKAYLVPENAKGGIETFLFCFNVV